jgi:hypothetical protein
METTTRLPSQLALEYEQINENFRLLADVRFKLLALLPVLGGAAIFVLAGAGLNVGDITAPSGSRLVLVLVVAVLGLAATLGITLYDQRNSELYNALIHRARHIEREFNLPPAPGGLKQASLGGQFRERPSKHRWLILQAGHDLALALIYGPLLGAWLFPIAYAGCYFGEPRTSLRSSRPPCWPASRRLLSPHGSSQSTSAKCSSTTLRPSATAWTTLVETDMNWRSICKLTYADLTPADRDRRRLSYPQRPNPRMRLHASFPGTCGK